MPPKQTPPPTPTTAQRLGSLIKSVRDIMRKDKGLNGDLDRLPMLTWILFLKFLDDMEQLREDEAVLAGKRFTPTIEQPYRWRDWAAREDGITGDELIAFISQDEATLPDGSRGPGLFACLRSLRSDNGRDRRDVVANVFKGVYNRMTSGYLLRDVINKVNNIHFTSSEEIHTLGTSTSPCSRRCATPPATQASSTPRAPWSSSWSPPAPPNSEKPSWTPPAAPAASWSRPSTTSKSSARPWSSAKPSRNAAYTEAKPSPCPISWRR